MKAEMNAGVYRRLRGFMPASSHELRHDYDTADEAEIEAFQTSEGLNAHGIRTPCFLPDGKIPAKQENFLSHGKNPCHQAVIKPPLNATSHQNN